MANSLMNKWWKQNGYNSKKAGEELEDRVAKMYSRLQKWGVKKNIIMKDRFGNISEIDVRYGIFRKFYIECKNYGSKPVPLSDVAKFRAVLELNGIPLTRYVLLVSICDDSLPFDFSEQLMHWTFLTLSAHM
jgi:hypothetical protein